jgi:hypothetical protein
MNDCADYFDGNSNEQKQKVISYTFTKTYTYDSAVRHLENCLNSVLTARGYHESEGVSCLPEPAKLENTETVKPRRKARYFGKNAQPFRG